MKDIKYMGAYEYLCMCTVKGVEIPKEVLEVLYELVEMYYSENQSD